MKRNWKGMGKVFAFTFKQKWNTRRWRVATFLIAALLSCCLRYHGLLELASGGGNTSSANPVTQVFVADETGHGFRGLEPAQRLGDGRVHRNPVHCLR